MQYMNPSKCEDITAYKSLASKRNKSISAFAVSDMRRVTLIEATFVCLKYVCVQECTRVSMLVC